MKEIGPVDHFRRSQNIQIIQLRMLLIMRKIFQSDVMFVGTVQLYPWSQLPGTLYVLAISLSSRDQAQRRPLIGWRTNPALESEAVL